MACDAASSKLAAVRELTDEAALRTWLVGHEDGNGPRTSGEVTAMLLLACSFGSEMAVVLLLELRVEIEELAKEFRRILHLHSALLAHRLHHRRAPATPAAQRRSARRVRGSPS